MASDEVNINLTLKQREPRRLPYLKNMVYVVQLQLRRLKIKTEHIRRPVTKLLNVLIVVG